MPAPLIRRKTNESIQFEPNICLEQQKKLFSFFRIISKECANGIPHACTVHVVKHPDNC